MITHKRTAARMKKNAVVYKSNDIFCGAIKK